MKARRVTGKEKYKGLMFAKSRDPILIEFEKETMQSLHMFFVPFRVYALWIDSQDKIIEGKWLERRTWGHKPSRPFKKVLEIPEPKQS